MLFGFFHTNELSPSTVIYVAGMTPQLASGLAWSVRAA